MNKKLTCNQVNSLINTYLQGNLNSKLEQYVNFHLENCPVCRKKVKQLKTFLNNLEKSKHSKKNKSVEPPDYHTIDRLSAYMDNELNPNENIKVKKMTITNSKIRGELETLYKFQKALRSAYNKTKNDSKFDYSKSVITQLQDGYEYSTTYFYKLAAVFTMLLTAIIVGFLYLYYIN